MRRIILTACALPFLLATSPAMAWYGGCDCGDFGASSGAKHSLFGSPRGGKDHYANTDRYERNNRLPRSGGYRHPTWSTDPWTKQRWDRSLGRGDHYGGSNPHSGGHSPANERNGDH